MVSRVMAEVLAMAFSTPVGLDGDPPVGVDAGEEGAEQRLAVCGGSVRVFGVPLDADQPDVGVSVFDGFDHSVETSSGYSQGGCDVTDGLVVAVSHGDLGASEDLGEARACFDDDGVVDEGRAVAVTSVGAVGAQVGDEGAAVSDVDGLGSSAYPEHRSAVVQSPANGFDGALVAAPVASSDQRIP